MKMIDINKELGITSIDFNNIDINNNTEDNIDDFFKETLDDLDKFDEKAWKKGDGLIFPNYPVFTEKLEGIDAGLYLFAGLSNSGKSAIMMNLLNDCCMYKENNVFGLYISLDDSNYEIIARLIAMEEKIPIGIASKPQRYKNKLENAKLNEYYSEEYDLIEKQLKKREDGLEKLRKNNDKNIYATDAIFKNYFEDEFSEIDFKMTFKSLKTFDGYFDENNFNIIKDYFFKGKTYNYIYLYSFIDETIYFINKFENKPFASIEIEFDKFNDFDEAFSSKFLGSIH